MTHVHRKAHHLHDYMSLWTNQNIDDHVLTFFFVFSSSGNASTEHNTFCVTCCCILPTCTQLSRHANYQYSLLLFFLILILQSKPECSAPAIDKVYVTREPIATSNGKKRLDLPVQKNILTNYFCILSTYCYFDHEYVTSIKFTYYNSELIATYIEINDNWSALTSISKQVFSS